MKSLTCHGGPLAGQTHVVSTDARIYWAVEGRIVANTSQLEWMDFEKARGAYIVYSMTVSRHQRQVLMWRAMPNRSGADVLPSPAM